MEISYDPAKRARTLAERGLDFEDAALVFAGLRASDEDRRRDYSEARMITAGYLRERFVIVVWTQRGSVRHIISMRYGHANEERLHADRLGLGGP